MRSHFVWLFVGLLPSMWNLYVAHATDRITALETQYRVGCIQYKAQCDLVNYQKAIRQIEAIIKKHPYDPRRPSIKAYWIQVYDPTMHVSTGVTSDLRLRWKTKS